MKCTLLLQASQIKLITLRLTELFVIVWLIFWTGTYLTLAWHVPLYHYVTLHTHSFLAILFYSGFLLVNPLWFSLLWSLVMSDVVPYLDEAMQWATGEVIDRQICFQSSTHRESSCHGNTFLLYTIYRKKVLLPYTFFWQMVPFSHTL